MKLIFYIGGSQTLAASALPSGLAKQMSWLQSESLIQRVWGKGLRIFISNKLPAAAGATGLGTTL